STLKVWDAATGRQRFDFKGHTSFVAGAAFSSDGKRLSSYGMDGTMRVWDLSTDEEPAVLKRPPDFDRRFRFSPDGRYLAQHLVNVPKEDPKAAAVEVRLWEAASGKELFRVKGLSFTAAQAVFSPDSKRLAVATTTMVGVKPVEEGAIRVWDIAA